MCPAFHQQRTTIVPPHPCRKHLLHKPDMSWRQGGEGGREKEAEGEGALVLSEPGYTVQSSYHHPVSEPDPDPRSSSPVGLVPRLTTIQLF